MNTIFKINGNNGACLTIPFETIINTRYVLIKSLLERFDSVNHIVKFEDNEYLKFENTLNDFLTKYIRENNIELNIYSTRAMLSSVRCLLSFIKNNFTKLKEKEF